MKTFRLHIKGEREGAIAEAVRRGFREVDLVYEGERVTVLRGQIDEPPIGWFTEESGLMPGVGYPKGALLWFKEENPNGE